MYLYDKPDFKIETEAEAINSLRVLRHLTEKGVVYPGTRWAVYKDTAYHIYGITRQLDPVRTGSPKPKEHYEPFLTVEQIETELGRKIQQGDWDNFIFREDSAVTRWFDRVKPSSTSEVNLTSLLNPMEAMHANNWGWDPESGVLYPIDIEVISINHPDEKQIIDEWCQANPMKE